MSCKPTRMCLALLSLLLLAAGAPDSSEGRTLLDSGKFQTFARWARKVKPARVPEADRDAMGNLMWEAAVLGHKLGKRALKPGPLFEKAAALRPGDARVLMDRADYLVDRRKGSAALAVLVDAEKLGERSPRHRFLWSAALFYTRGRREEGQALLYALIGETEPSNQFHMRALTLVQPPSGRERRKIRRAEAAAKRKVRHELRKSRQAAPPPPAPEVPAAPPAPRVPQTPPGSEPAIPPETRVVVRPPGAPERTPAVIVDPMRPVAAPAQPEPPAASGPLQVPGFSIAYAGKDRRFEGASGVEYELKVLLKEARNTVGPFLGHTPPDALDVVLHTARRFKKRYRRSAHRGFDAVYRDAQLHISEAKELGPELRAAIVHEYTRAVIEDAVQGRKDMPAWLREGIAAAATSRWENGFSDPDDDEVKTLRAKAKKKRLPKLSRMTKKNPGRLKNAKTAMLTSHAAVWCLERRAGAESIPDYLARMGRKQKARAAFIAAFGMTPKAFPATLRDCLK